MPVQPATLFISHASEEKADFVRPLAHALKKQGLRVWYDEFSLKPGDSLRRSIDNHPSWRSRLQLFQFSKTSA